MGFLTSFKKALWGHQGSGSSKHRDDDPHAYWIYVQCRRCGEPLKARVNLMNEPSEADEGEGWIVRKGLVGSGANRCFQTVEVMLRFDERKQSVIESEVLGGKLITEEEYEVLKQAASEKEQETTSNE